MKKAIPALIAVVALAGAAATWVAPGRAEGQAGQDGKGTFKLGVVNLKVCFEKEHYERIKDIDAQLQQKRDEYERRLRDIENRMTELQENLNSLPRESALRPEKILQLRRLESDRKFEQEYGRTKFMEFYSDRKIDIYNEVRRVVTMIAQEQHFDLILRVEAPMLEEQDPESVSQRINNRVVLYNHEGVDITKDVVKRLNELWAKKKTEPPPPAEWECPKCKKKNKAADATCTATKDCPGKKP